jgi:hypothetical protein
MSKKPYSDPRWYDDPKPVSPPCNSCAHYHVRKCDAFPEGIPVAVLNDLVKHGVPEECAPGIRFEPKEASQ